MAGFVIAVLLCSHLAFLPLTREEKSFLCQPDKQGHEWGWGSEISSTHPTAAPTSCAAFTSKTSPPHNGGQRGTCERQRPFLGFPRRSRLPAAAPGWAPSLADGRTSLEGAQLEGKAFPEQEVSSLLALATEWRQKVKGRFAITRCKLKPAGLPSKAIRAGPGAW